MSEFQRYEFMTCDRPLTQAQLKAVNTLSSHIEASSTYALIEYNWGDFKHDPINVLYKYFDGFLYWANWGSPELAFRFPHGILPDNMLADFGLDDFVTLSTKQDYDILHFSFEEINAPDEWIDYNLASLIGLRDELIEEDYRSLYIAWLASQQIRENEDDEDDEDDEEEEDEVEEVEEAEEVEEYHEVHVPPVPPNFGKLTTSQQALAELLQVPQVLLDVTARHSGKAAPPVADDFSSLVGLLSPERQRDYLLRLASNEAGLSRKLVKELRELDPERSQRTKSTGERVTYAKLLAESNELAARLEREKRERARAARLRHLQDIHDHQESFWQQIDEELQRGSGSGYGKAVQILVELREVAKHFNETPQFQARFRNWIQPNWRRPALIRRLLEQGFTLPEA